MSNEPLLTIHDVCGRLKVTRGTVYNLVRAGRLPGPVRLSMRSVRWRPEDIDVAIARLADRSRDGAAR